MEGIEGLEDRQRVDRRLEESQYLDRPPIPAYLDDRDRMRSRLEMVEQDNERLQIELAARREISELRTVSRSTGERGRLLSHRRAPGRAPETHQGGCTPVGRIHIAAAQRFGKPRPWAPAPPALPEASAAMWSIITLGRPTAP